MSAAVILVVMYALGAVGWYDLVADASGDRRMATLVASVWPLSLMAGGLYVLWSRYDDWRIVREHARRAAPRSPGTRGTP